jgi:hypothetical protein
MIAADLTPDRGSTYSNIINAPAAAHKSDSSAIWSLPDYQCYMRLAYETGCSSLHEGRPWCYLAMRRRTHCVIRQRTYIPSCVSSVVIWRRGQIDSLQQQHQQRQTNGGGGGQACWPASTPCAEAALEQ